MKTLDLLIRKYQLELDEIRKDLVKAEDEKQELQKYHEKMAEELQREHEIASKNPQMSATFENYRDVIHQRQYTIKHAISDLDHKIETIRGNIAVKFTEVKKYEILRDKKLYEQKKAEDAAESKQLDEIAANIYLHNGD